MRKRERAARICTNIFCRRRTHDSLDFRLFAYFLCFGGRKHDDDDDCYLFGEQRSRWKLFHPKMLSATRRMRYKRLERRRHTLMPTFSEALKHKRHSRITKSKSKQKSAIKPNKTETCQPLIVDVSTYFYYIQTSASAQTSESRNQNRMHLLLAEPFCTCTNCVWWTNDNLWNAEIVSCEWCSKCSDAVSDTRSCTRKRKMKLRANRKFSFNLSTFEDKCKYYELRCCLDSTEKWLFYFVVFILIFIEPQPQHRCCANYNRCGRNGILSLHFFRFLFIISRCGTTITKHHIENENSSVSCDTRCSIYSRVLVLDVLLFSRPQHTQTHTQSHTQSKARICLAEWSWTNWRTTMMMSWLTAASFFVCVDCAKSYKWTNCYQFNDKFVLRKMKRKRNENANSIHQQQQR